MAVTNRNLVFPSDSIQELSTRVLRALCISYGLDEKRSNFLDVTVKHYWNLLEGKRDNVYIRRGVARVFGQLPHRLYDTESIYKVQSER